MKKLEKDLNGIEIDAGFDAYEIHLLKNGPIVPYHNVPLKQREEDFKALMNDRVRARHILKVIENANQK